MLPTAGELVSVIVLAGGRSVRMGQDKAWLIFDGQPLVSHIVRHVLSIAAEIIISANDADRYVRLAGDLGIHLPIHVVTDTYAGAGPLAGLESGLSVCSSELALLLAVDMPFVKLSLLDYMRSQAEDYDAVLPVVAAELGAEPNYEPLHALYRRTCLPAIRAHLSAGHRRVISFLPDVRVRVLKPDETALFDPDGLSFYNVNTPEDWEMAQQLLSGGPSDWGIGRK